MKRKHRRIKVLLSTFFTFLLTLLLLILFFSMGLGIGAFNNQSIRKAIDKSDYLDKAYADIRERAEEILSQSGLPSSLLSDIITQSRVHADGMNYASEALSAKQEQDNTNSSIKLHEEVQAAILEYAHEEEVWQSDEMSDSIIMIADAIEDEYKSSVEIKFLEYYLDYKSGYKRQMMVIIPSSMLLIGILCYMIIRMHRYKYRGIRYISYGLIASSVLMMALAWYSLYTKAYDTIRIAPYYYQHFIYLYLKLSIAAFAYIGMMGILVAVVLITLIGAMRNRIIST